MKKQSSTTLKLAILFAMAVTMALSAARRLVYMVSQDNLCGNDPLCDTNHLWTVDLLHSVQCGLPRHRSNRGRRNPRAGF